MIKEERKEDIEKIFDFLHEVGNLKNVKRYGKIEPGKNDITPDSTADHTWRLTLMALVLKDELNLDIDLLKAMKIAVVHDLPETITGDIDYREIVDGNVTKEEKQKEKIKTMKKITNHLSEKIGKGVLELWEEYEKAETREALFVKALDKIETITHVVEKGKCYTYHNLIATYPDKHVKNFPELKPVLRELKKRVKKEYEKRNIEWKKEYDKYEDEI